MPESAPSSNDGSGKAPAATAAAAPGAVVDYEKLTFALRPPDRTRPARAARLTVRESCTVFPKSSSSSSSHGADGSGSGSGKNKDVTVSAGEREDGKSRTPAAKSKPKPAKGGGGILKTPRKNASADGTGVRTPTSSAKKDAMDIDGDAAAAAAAGDDVDDDDDASADTTNSGSSTMRFPSDDAVDRSVQTMYVMDGDTGRIVSTTRVRPVVVRDGRVDEDGDDGDDEEEEEENDFAQRQHAGGFEEVVGYEEIDDTADDDGDDDDDDDENEDGKAGGADNGDGDAMDIDDDGYVGDPFATKKATPTKTESGLVVPGAVPTSASSAGEDEEEDSGDEEYVPGSDPLTAMQDQLPLESLPGRPTISFRRAEADGRLVALLKSRSAMADDIVRGLARSTDEYSRHVGDDGASAEDGGSTNGSGLASLVMKDANRDETELRRRLRLEKRRLAMELPGTRSYLPPDLHEVMLGDWESQIDWEGVKVEEVGSNGVGGSGSSNAGASAGTVGSNPLAAGAAILAETSKSSSASSSTLAAVRPTRKKSMDPHALLSTPYNPELDAMDFTSAVSWLGADAPPGHNTALARSVPLVLERSVAGRSVALPAAAPPVRPLPFGATNVFEARYERELSTVASSTASSLPGSSFRPDGDKLEAIIKAKQERRQKLATKKSHRIMEAMGTLGLGGGKGRTITSSLMGPGGTERTGRVARGAAGGTSAHDAEYVEQLEIVYNHSMIKPDFTKIQLRQYHRPRLPRALVRTDRQWQFQIKVQAAKFGKPMDRVAGADGSTVLGSYQSAFGGTAASKAGSIRSESDLSASEGQLAIIEYCEERPLLQLLKGHTVRIVNYYRGDKAKTPISAGGGDRPARKRHHGDKASADDPNDAGASGKIEKPPRLKGPNQAGKNLLPSAADLVGVSKKKKKKDGMSGSAAVGASSGDNNERSREASKVTILPDGVTEVLHPKVHGPFIGEVEDGMTQTGLVTNLFVAPMFRHESEPTDFLMILGKKPSSKHAKEGGEPQALGVCLRPFPANVYAVGQVEPRVKVFQPNTNQEKNFTTPFVTYQIAKAVELSELRNDGEGLSLDEIGSLFESNPIPPNALRMRIKQVATYDRESGHYTTKAIGFEDYPGVEALSRRFTPEGVAAYESSCAASIRLSDLGLQVLHTGASSVHSVGAAMVFLTSRLNAARERKSKMAKNLHFANTSKSKTTANQIALYEKAAKKLEDEWKEIKRRHEVAKFIYEELQLAPWHLSNEFIDVHKNAQGTGMMRLTGLGDPSGRGEGYSFIRESDAKPNKGTGNSDGALNAQIKKITGTENDLRKLTMKQMASLLRSYGMGQKEIDTLKRWDRVHVIRDLSTKAASDGMADGLERYARGEKMKLRDQKRMYQDRIQEIWRRQRAALSTDAITRGGGESGEVADGDEGKEAAAVDKKLDEEMKAAESDDSDDDDDLAAAFEEDLMDVKETSELVTAQIRGTGDETAFRAMGGRTKEDRQDLSKDARELAALKRQRQEEREAQGLIGNTEKGEASVPQRSLAGRKVIRRRITKTHPDGSQTTTFKFIVLPTEVEKVLEAKKAKEEQTKATEKKKRRSRHRFDAAKFEDDGGENIVGHSIFEDDDDDENRGGGIKIKVQRRTVKKKGGGATTSPSKSSVSAYSKPKTSTAAKSLGKTTVGGKAKKKRKREEEEDDFYESKYLKKGNSNRRERGSARERMPHVIFADRLEAIRATVERRPNSGAFHRPVSRRDIPRYYEVVSQPISLMEIGDRISKYSYKTADAMVADFDLMKNNAIKFNGAESGLAKEAMAIYDYVKNIINDNRAEFDAMEEAVDDQMSGKKKKKKKTKTSSKQSDAAGTGGGSGKMADIVLDGVKTSVDVGDLDNFNFDAESDSDDDDVIGKLNL